MKKGYIEGRCISCGLDEWAGKPMPVNKHGRCALCEYTKEQEKMNEEFKKKLNKLVDQVAETTKEASGVATEGVSSLWKEFIDKGYKAQEAVNKAVEKAEKRL